MALKALLFAALLVLSLSHSDDMWLGQKNKPGLVKLPNGDELFYWLFYARENENTAPLNFWLAGGPGCSSTLNTFIENGPFYLNDDLSLRLNENSWSSNANLVYVDQPVGVGFSSVSSQGDYKTNEQEVAKDFHKLLEGFFEQNPQFQGRDVYITGESFAGHFIPAIAGYLIQQDNLPFKLKGLGLGDGWTDPIHQYPQNPRYSYQNGLIDESGKQILDVGYQICLEKIKNDEEDSGSYCRSLQLAVTGKDKWKFNPYDIRKPCPNPPACYDFSIVQRFLSQDDVLESLGVQGRKWSQCSRQAQAKMAGDFNTDQSHNVEAVLAAGVKVVAFTGDKDWICNWRGGEAWLSKLKFDGQEGFINQEYKKWEVDSEDIGRYKEVKGLSFVIVYGAGHLAAMDQPKNCLRMLDDFLYQ